MPYDPIPRDWPVQPLKRHQNAKDRCTCGHCGLSWDDGKVTEMTPTPSGRCPFESFHVYEEPEEQVGHIAFGNVLALIEAGDAMRRVLTIPDNTDGHCWPDLDEDIRPALEAYAKARKGLFQPRQ